MPAAQPPTVADVERPLEDLAYERLRTLLARLGGRAVPDLHRTVLGQVERALLRAALEQTDGHQAQAAKLLGLDRNTLARRARALGLPVSGRPGPKARRAGR